MTPIQSLSARRDASAPWRVAGLLLAFAACASLAAAQDVDLTIGDLQSESSITIEFLVVVDDPVAAGVGEVSNQGSVTSTNSPGLLTDDPDAPGAADPTITLLDLPVSLAEIPALGPVPLALLAALLALAAVASLNRRQRRQGRR